MPVIHENEIVHVATRRMFPEEPKRHFAGRVRAIEGDLLRVEGYAFVFHSGRNEFQKRPEKRVRVFGLADAANTVNVLPDAVDLETLRYSFVKGQLLVVDDKGFTLDVNEYGPHS